MGEVVAGRFSTNERLASPAGGDHNIRHGDGNGGGDDMQARVAKLESDVDYIKKSIGDIKDDVREIKRDARTDFRLTFGALIAVALGLAGLMAKGFHWI